MGKPQRLLTEKLDINDVVMERAHRVKTVQWEEEKQQEIKTNGGGL